LPSAPAGSDAPQLPHRETDPAAYIVTTARQVEDRGAEMDPHDKALAMGLFRAAFTFTAEDNED
jgi:hypothetical protein